MSETDGRAGPFAVVPDSPDLLNRRERIVSIPDFPIPGFDFNVITPLLADGERFGLAVDELARQEASLNFAAAVAVESPVLVLGA